MPLALGRAELGESRIGHPRPSDIYRKFMRPAFPDSLHQIFHGLKERSRDSKTTMAAVTRAIVGFAPRPYRAASRPRLLD